MNNKGKSVYISDNVRLYKQVRSPYWWVNIRLGEKQKRMSTKVLIENDPDGSKEARTRATEIATELKFKVEHGIDISGKPSFSKMADKVVESLNNKPTQKDIYKAYIRVIDHYLKPYFKRVPIDKVDRPQIYQFYQWREQEVGSRISETQKRVTNKALMLIFDLACDLGYIKQNNIPKLPRVEVKRGQVKDFFNADELKRVLGSFDGFIEASRNKKTREIRQLLKFYTHFLSGTGARTGKEVNSLKYGDIGRERIRNNVTWYATITKGKVFSRKGSRKIILSDRAVDALRGVVRLRSYLKGESLEKVIRDHPEKQIFTADYRESIPDFIKSFQQYMAYLGMSDKKHSLYSLRHTYITHALLAGKMPRRAIAKQCGNSEEMIEQYYDHVLTLDYAEELKRSDNMPSLTTTDITQFFGD